MILVIILLVRLFFLLLNDKLLLNSKKKKSWPPSTYIFVPFVYGIAYLPKSHFDFILEGNKLW